MEGIIGNPDHKQPKKEKKIMKKFWLDDRPI